MKLAPLTSLRFFAALGVFLIHYNQLYLQSKNSVIVYLRPIFFEGYLWVGFFFILSGFIISYSQGKKKEKDTPSHFLLKRFARIYPVHLLMLAFFYFYFNNTWIMDQQNSIIYNFLLMQSFIPVAHTYWGYNAVSWSISTEAFFYVSFLFLSLLKPKYLLSLFLMLTFTLVASHLYEFESRDFMVWSYYINPISRSVDFIAGILLYHLYEYSKDKKIAAILRGTTAEVASILIMVVFMAIAIKTQFTKSFRYDLYYIIPMSLIIFTFALSEGAISKFLSHRALIILGESSFCLYMTHQLFISIAINKLIGSPETASTGRFLLLMPAMLAMAIMLSLLIHMIYEKPVAKLIVSLTRSKSINSERG